MRRRRRRRLLRRNNLKSATYLLIYLLTYRPRNLSWLTNPGDESTYSGSCRVFESQRRILDGHFIAYICCKNRNVFLKRAK